MYRQSHRRHGPLGRDCACQGNCRKGPRTHHYLHLPARDWSGSGNCRRGPLYHHCLRLPGPGWRHRNSCPRHHIHHRHLYHYPYCSDRGPRHHIHHRHLYHYPHRLDRGHKHPRRRRHRCRPGRGCGQLGSCRSHRSGHLRLRPSPGRQLSHYRCSRFPASGQDCACLRRQLPRSHCPMGGWPCHGHSSPSRQ